MVRAGGGTIRRFFSSHDQDVALGFLTSFAGQVVTVNLLYLWLLQLTEFAAGLGWWLFSFFALGYWGWLGVAVLWAVLVRVFLPEAGIWSPAVGSIYAAVALAFMFHMPWLWSALVVGLGSLAMGILLPTDTRRWGISPLIGLALVVILVTIRLGG
ncbi:hypothetical protein [Anthocerotibacter panamensis]|uniref:hypothetical protein n=1 Tax=Anthocerotibacter panamensis TaxID=2857077 RepID=UPI001C401F86|nr:hypothetical protein [Anthocerotibacter panamensis]